MLCACEVSAISRETGQSQGPKGPERQILQAVRRESHLGRISQLQGGSPGWLDGTVATGSSGRQHREDIQMPVLDRQEWRLDRDIVKV